MDRARVSWLPLQVRVTPTMGFDLFIAAKRAPHDPSSAGESPTSPRVSVRTLQLNGALDEAAVDAILAAVSKLSDEGADSISIEMERVSAEDPAPLHKLASGMMALRSAGVHVQVAVREPSLHDRMCDLKDARDWLVATPDADVTGARRAIHLDGPHQQAATRQGD